MAICLFVRKCFDGSGDVVQTVKIADFIQKFTASSELEELRHELVFIVVEDDKNEEIVSRFVKDTNLNIQVKKISEFKEENHKINCCIEAGYSHFNWEKYISFKGEKPPLIVMPEYNNDVNRESVLRILGGFDKDKGDVGVIPSPSLLDATAEEMISTEILQNAFEKLDPKIKSLLGKDKESFLAQREQRDFTYQYGHDKSRYPTFHSLNTSYKIGQHGDKVEQGKHYFPVEFFLQEHLVLMGDSVKSQDVLCIGERHESKLQSLVGLKNDLINKGYTKISFIDIDKRLGQIIYEAEKGDRQHKEYRMLYSKSVPFSSMQVLPLIATTDIVGVTGDQSLIEAMSARKLVSYECIQHKKDFAEGYLKAVQREILEADLGGTSREEILILAKFLIKPSYRCNNVEYKQEEISRLLINKNTVEALKNINRRLVAQSQYFSSLEKILMSEVLPYIKNEPGNELKLVPLLKALCLEITNNKTESDRWQQRFAAATHLSTLTRDNKAIDKKDFSFIKAQLMLIKENEPSWHERSLITQILDILSLGLIPLMRCLFFTSDNTMNYVNETEASTTSNFQCI